LQDHLQNEYTVSFSITSWKNRWAVFSNQGHQNKKEAGNEEEKIIIGTSYDSVFLLRMCLRFACF